MSQVKLTKNELRQQQTKLISLEKYLPTLKLKKSLLQAEVLEAKTGVQRLEVEQEKALSELEAAGDLLTLAPGWDLEELLEVKNLKTGSENIAGVEVPTFLAMEFDSRVHPLSQTPLWWDRFVELSKEYRLLVVQVYIAKLRQEAFEKEFREVSIRVNLFEKILIPRAIAQIKKIKIFLQDQELASVARAKVAKSKHRPENAHESEGAQEMFA